MPRENFGLCAELIDIANEVWEAVGPDGKLGGQPAFVVAGALPVMHDIARLLSTPKR